MTYKEAYEELVNGNRVKLPEINAYIYMENGTLRETDGLLFDEEIEVFTNELKEREDWEVVDNER